MLIRSYRRALVKALALPAFMGLCLATAAFAADKPQIALAMGSSSASLKGEIQGMDRDTYPITAKAGQTMRVKVSNKLKLVIFHIKMPGEDGAYLPKAGEEDDATAWEGTLPVSGAYKIIVGAMRGKDTKYTLDVQISN
ncbi:hypothetical protein [Fundidesulfovibrio terrae]|uniref:hypothetical protein n=1 Tax=Fundidesulfovibrio terrae TaxID=2922866 RepID=UPI001FAE96DB|nr:hypothetical protein [Fundidesulfovibrio terrae]